MLLLLLIPVRAYAQHEQTPGGAQTVAVIPKTPLERELQHEIICMCRSCGRQRLADCQCPKAAQMRTELAGLVAKGMTREQIYDHYMALYGSEEPLASPINKGLNVLAWMFPYVAGVSGAAVAAFVAVRWTRRPDGGAPETAAVTDRAGEDPALRERLDDELRDLD
jgi:cytochrome c-type biogenesis protein CcmH/NrfF